MSSVKACIEDVEPRILFSADTAVLGIEPYVTTDTYVVVAPAQSQEQAESTQETQLASSLVVLDAGLPELDSLIADLDAQRTAGAPVDWLVIGSGTDGVTALTQHLQQTPSPYSAIHIFTHGEDGHFELGSELVDTQLLRQRASDLASWSAELTESADVLIYGCNLANSAIGQQLVSDLSILTGADVAASDDRTGHASLGADWVLEYRLGEINSAIPVSAQFTDNWVGTLDISLTGTEQVVNEPTTNDQVFRDNHGGRQIATNGTDMVVVWEETGDKDIYFRLYDADGTPRAGGEQLVENTGGWDREEPAVAMQSNGDFVIVWTSKNQDGDNDGIFAQRFNADGTPKARPVDAFAGTYANAFEFRVNDTTAQEQRRAAVASRDDGSFIITWEAKSTGNGFNSYNAMYRAFNADGTRIGGTSDDYVFLDFADLEQQNVSIAAGPNGGDMIAAFEYERSNGDREIRLREIRANGSTGTMTTIASSGDALRDAQVSMNASGAYAVIYQNENSDTIEVMRYDSAGNNLDSGNPITVSALGAVKAEHPSLALADDGRILAVWEVEEASGGKDDIVAIEIAADGTVSGSELVIPVTTNNDQLRPDVVFTGNLASVVWDGEGPLDNRDIMLRTMTVINPAVLVTPGATNTGEDGTFVDIDFVLATQPTDDVVVTVSSNDPGEGATDQGSLTFTTANWDTAQTVRVTGQDDAVVDGSIAYQVNYTIASVGDTNYSNLPGDAIDLTNVDNDVPSVSDVGSVSDTDPAPDQILESATPGNAVGVTALAVDPDPIDTVSYSLSSNLGNLFFVDPSSGVITLNVGASLDREAQQTHTITVRATSTDTSFSEQNFDISVLDVNDNTPVISGAGFTVAENLPLSTLVGVPAVTDPDTTGNLQNWQIVGGTGNTAFSIDVTSGEIRVLDPNQLNHEATPTLTLSLTVSDGVNTSASQSITITVGDEFEVPIGGNSTISVTEDTPYTLLIGDFAYSDPDTGDQLANILIESIPDSGTFELATSALSVGQSVSRAQIVAGDLVYRPADNAYGTPLTSFSVTVYDPTGLGAATQNVVTVDVAAQNDPPEIISNGGAASVAISIVENSSTATTVMAGDVDLPAQTLTYDISGGADAARFNMDAAGNLTFQVSPDFEAPVDADGDNIYQVVVRARDPLNAQDEQTILVTVTNQTENLTVSAPATVTTPEDTVAVFAGGDSLTITDPDLADALSVTVSVDQGALSLTQTTGLVFTTGDGFSDMAMTFSGSLANINAAIAALQYEPTDNDNGTRSLSLNVSDPVVPSRQISHDVTITITAVNDVPVISGSLTQVAPAGETQTITPATINASDIEDSAAGLTYTLTQAPTSGVLLLNGSLVVAGASFSQADINSGQLAYRPADPMTGTTDAIEVFLADTDGATVGSIRVSIQAQVTAVFAPPASSELSSSTDSDNDPSESFSDDDSGQERDDDGEEVGRFVQMPGDSGYTADGTGSSDSADANDEETQSGRHETSRKQFSDARRSILTESRFTYDGRQANTFIGELAKLSGEGPRNVRGVLSGIEFLRSDDYARGLDTARDDLFKGIQLEQRVVASSIVASAGFSIGYVLWLLRGGALLSSILASMPAWRSIDPIPVLGSMALGEHDAGDDESLEEMLDSSTEQSIDADGEDTPDT